MNRSGRSLPTGPGDDAAGLVGWSRLACATMASYVAWSMVSTPSSLGRVPAPGATGLLLGFFPARVGEAGFEGSGLSVVSGKTSYMQVMDHIEELDEARAPRPARLPACERAAHPGGGAAARGAVRGPARRADPRPRPASSPAASGRSLRRRRHAARHRVRAGRSRRPARLSRGPAHSIGRRARPGSGCPSCGGGSRRSRCKASYARFVARRTRDLTVEQAAYVDARVAEAADGRIPWTRFEELVDGAIAASDPRRPPSARRRRRRAPGRQPDPLHRGRHARLLRPRALPRHRPAGRERGTTSPTSWPTSATPTPSDERRVKAVLDPRRPPPAVALMRLRRVARPAADPSRRPDRPSSRRRRPRSTGRPDADGDALRPQSTPATRSTGVARVEGHGPGHRGLGPQHLGPHARFTVSPVIDLDGPGARSTPTRSPTDIGRPCI